MLGKHHSLISVLTILPFMIPLLFLGDGNSIAYFFALLFSVSLGSLMPDADCGGKPALFFKFRFIYDMMIPIRWITVKIFNISKIKHKLKLEYVVDNEHRGIMHSPIGILISSFLITLAFSIILLLIEEFNVVLVLLVFFGLGIGQLLHILEDSCTVSGINWGFPFKEKHIKGKIYTFGKIKDHIDTRPNLYQNILIGFSIIIALVYAFNIVTISIFLVYPVILIILILLWVIFFKIANNESQRWYVHKDVLKQRKRNMKKVLKELE